MKLFKRGAFTLALFATTLCLGPSSVSAQSAVQGSFKLPFETHWGSLDLKPGAYTMHIDRSASGVHLLYLRGPAGTQVRLLGGYSMITQSDRNFIRVTNVGGTQTVSEFYCGILGQTYTYKVPKVIKLEAQGSTQPTDTLIAINRR
jgi:hypothetical protein